jgi:hypothetical protein
MSSGDKAIIASSLVFGMSSIHNPKDFLEKPISTVANGMFVGTLYGIGAELVSTNFNENQKVIFAGLITVAAVYHFAKKIFIN